MPSVDKTLTVSGSQAGDGINVKKARWSFGGDVALKFDDHVSKSVPLYDNGHDLTTKLSDFFVRSDSTVYELGSSTGTLIRKLAERHSDHENASFIGLEVEPDMVSFAKKRHIKMKNISFETCCVENFEFERSDFITSHYTIQFVPPKYRQELFNRIYQALDWGGAFVLFEKVRANDARFQDIFTTLYNEFKIDSGYAMDEILAKSLSLKGAMEPFSTEANVDFMRRAGFSDIITIQKYLFLRDGLRSNEKN